MADLWTPPPPQVKALDPCPECNGTLGLPGLDEGGLGVDFARPCQDCLSVPVTVELLVSVMETLGVSADRSHHWVPWAAWWDNKSPRSAVVPAYVPAGRDCLARCLYQKLGHRVGATAPHFSVWNERCWLLGGLLLTPTETETTFWSGPHKVIPTLGTIPSTAPEEVRAGRALILGWLEAAQEHRSTERCGSGF